MKLYWHKWVHRRGICYLLYDRPISSPESARPLGELAIVHRLHDHWEACCDQCGPVAQKWWRVGAPVSGRRLVQEWIDSKSIAMFDDDCVEFVPPGMPIPAH